MVEFFLGEPRAMNVDHETRIRENCNFLLDAMPGRSLRVLAPPWVLREPGDSTTASVEELQAVAELLTNVKPVQLYQCFSSF